MSQRYGVAGLDLPHADESSKIYRILSSAMQKQLDARSRLAPRCPLYCPMPSTRPYAESGATALNAGLERLVDVSSESTAGLTVEPGQETMFWDASFFDLDRVTLFQESTPDDQRAILHLANLGLLQESYCIEKAGMGYMSRMALLAESTQERMIYTLFAADETSHFVQLHPFLSTEPTVADHPFLHLLSEVVEGDDKAVLLFVIQVVLEGWGLTHYRNLAKDCAHPELRETLHGFLQDESRHHGTGVTLFNQVSVSAISHAAIVEILAQFLQMVQVGPQGVLGAIAQVKGHLSRSQKIQILTELDTETHSGTRLQVLRSLMRGDGAGAIVQELDERGAFRPFAACECL